MSSAGPRSDSLVPDGASPGPHESHVAAQYLLGELKDLARGRLEIREDEEEWPEAARLLGEIRERWLDERQATIRQAAAAFSQISSFQQRERHLVDVLADGLVVLTPQRSISRVNQAFEELLDRKGHQLLGCPLAQILTAEARAQLGSWLDALLEGLPLCDVTLDFLHSDGVPIPLQVTGSVIHSPEREVEGIVLTARDAREARRQLVAAQSAAELERLRAEQLELAHLQLTAAHAELRKTQAKLIQTSKLASLGTLAAGVAHEMNQPLTAILTFGELIQDAPQKQVADVADWLQGILMSAERLARIVDNIRTFARQDSFQLQPSPALPPLEQALMLVSEQLRLQDIEVEWRTQEDLPPILADPSRLQQVFLNLLVNARDAIQESSGSRRKIALEVGREGDWVNYVVRDTGAGIPAEKVSRIFDPFFTTKLVGHGTGLGLSLSYGIVEEHGGLLRYERDQEAGETCFVVEVPAHVSTSRQPTPAL